MVEVTKIGNKTLVMDGKILSLFRRGSLLRQMWYGGYEDFDNANGGAWKKYINIPITIIPSEYAQYIIEIDDTNVSVYNAKGDLKAQASIASEFWSLVRSDGFDMRAFDHLFRQLWFWVEEFDYTNKKAKIWVKLPENSEELNIAFGNPRATRSDYDNPKQVFDLYDDFEGTSLDTNLWYEYKEANANAIVENGLLKVSIAQATSGINYHILSKINTEASIVEAKIKYISWGLYTFFYVALDKDYANSTTFREAPYSGYQAMHYQASPDCRELYRYDNGSKTLLASNNGDSDPTGQIIFVADLGEIVKAGEYGVWEASANDNTYAPPYYVKLGVRASSNASIEIHFDWIRAYKSADPASFTTPRIIEF